MYVNTKTLTTQTSSTHTVPLKYNFTMHMLRILSPHMNHYTHTQYDLHTLYTHEYKCGVLNALHV